MTLERRILNAVLHDLRGRQGLLDGIAPDVLTRELEPELLEAIRVALQFNPWRDSALTLLDKLPIQQTPDGYYTFSAQEWFGFVSAALEAKWGEPDSLACPFCRDAGFDVVGLKFHLTAGHCESYNSTKVELR